MTADDPWDLAIEATAQLCEEIEEALETGEWDRRSLVAAPTPPLTDPPTPEQRRRALAVGEELQRLVTEVGRARDAVGAELVGGARRRTAAKSYAVHDR